MFSISIGSSKARTDAMDGCTAVGDVGMRRAGSSGATDRDQNCCCGPPGGLANGPRLLQRGKCSKMKIINQE